ncbi:hypothetical protein [Mucilaginibacter sp.]|uniref:hypothetical protein n=1 Tax=Mucilaginibacter sp. TaxID=1882438 RepID=UPI00260D882E|nr:hypothetical protein [Mucilaginibacter sp.]MDB4920517.1 hypothetical protein [Mucilaginibacter sp.]
MEETSTATRLCLDCGNPIRAGRKDKKFCDDMCRTNYNNNKGTSSELSLTDYIKKIQTILEKNRKILDDCLSKAVEMEKIEARKPTGEKSKEQSQNHASKAMENKTLNDQNISM